MPGYRTIDQRIAIAGVDDLLIRSLADRQQFSDPDGTAERLGISSAAWPLFGMPWPSGAQLAARLALRPVNGAERILEVGCGLALASLVGHRRGANITASDHHPLTELFLRVNLRLNGLAPMAYLHAPWDEPSGPTVEFSHDHHAGEGEPGPAQFDLIIGSDLLYEPDAQGALAGFISRHAAVGAEIWIIDPDRHQRAQFNRQMSAHGFARSEERIDQFATSASTAYRGRLLTYRLRDSL